MNAFRLMLLPALGLALVTLERRAQTWPTKPLRAIVPVAAGSLTDIVPRVVFEQLSTQLGQSIVVENRPGAGRNDRRRLRRQGGPRRLHAPRQLVRAHDRAGALSEPGLPSGAGFCGGCPARHLAVRPGRSAGQGLQNSRRSCRCGQGEAGRVQLRLARRRQRIASERGTIPAQCGRAGRARPVQGRCGGHDRSDRGTDRLLLRARSGRPAANPGRQAHRACGEWRQRAPPRCPTFRPSGKPVSTMPSIRPGSGFSCRQRRRARSSTSFIARRSRRCRSRRCGTSSRTRYRSHGHDAQPNSMRWFRRKSPSTQRWSRRSD